MTILGSLLGERRAASYQDVYGKGGEWLAGASTAAGVTVTQETALRMVAVYACIRLIAETIAGMPADTFRREGRVRHPFRPRPIWLDRPNTEQTRFEVVEQSLHALLTDGNAYAALTRDRNGDVVEAWPLHPAGVTPDRTRTGERVYVVRDGNGERTLTAANRFAGELLHVRGFSAPGELKGLSPIEYARQTIGLGLVAEEFAARFFSNGANAGGVIELGGKPEPSVIERLRAGFMRRHSGVRNAHAPGVLTDGATWKQITIPPEHAQFLETRQFQVAEIARLFRVPPHMIGDIERSTSWGSGIEEQAQGFVTHTLRPWLERLEQAFNRLLPDGVFLKFNVDGLLRGDTKGRYQAYETAINAGFMNVDEVRALEDRPPIPAGAGQKFRQPLNHGPLGAAPTTTKEAA